MLLPVASAFAIVACAIAALLMCSVLGFPLSVMAAIALWACLALLFLWKAEIVLPMFICGQAVIHHLFSGFGGLARSRLTDSNLTISMLLVAPLIALLSFQSIRKRPEWIRVPLQYTLAIIPLSVVVLVGLTYTIAPNYGSRKVVGLFVYGLSVSYAVLFFVNTENRFKLFLWVIVFLSAFQAVGLSLVTYIQSGGIFEGIGGIKATSKTLFEGFVIAGHQDMGRRFMVGVLGAVGLAILSKSRISKIVLLLVCLLLSSWIIFSMARGPVLCTIATGLIFMVLLIVGNKGKAVWYVTIALVGLSLGLAVAEQDVVGRLIGKDKFARRSTQLHLDVYQKALVVFASSPVTGVGTGGFARKAFGVDQQIYPHNIELEILAEHGIIGFGAFMLFLILTVRRGLTAVMQAPQKSSRILAIWAFSWFAGNLMFAQFSGDLIRNDQLWISSAAIFCSAGFAELRRMNIAMESSGNSSEWVTV